MTKPPFLKYTVLLCCGPYQSQSALTALAFCRALLKNNHHLQQIFFYTDAVNLGARNHHVAEDEVDILDAWQQFISDHQLHAKLCVSAALKRGIIDDTYAKQYQSEPNCAQGFTLAGLSELYESMLESDRFISF